MCGWTDGQMGGLNRWMEGLWLEAMWMSKEVDE